MELVHEFDYYGTLNPPVIFGSHMFLEVTEGRVTGGRLNGRLCPVAETGSYSARMDGGRLTSVARLVPTNGAFIYTHYTGLLELNDKVMTATTSGAGTDWGDQVSGRLPIRARRRTLAVVATSLFVAEGQRSWKVEASGTRVTASRLDVHFGGR